MEWDLQFVAIIVTILLAIGGAFWRIIATMNKGFAEARKEAREAVDKLRTDMNAGFAEAKEEREKGFAAAEKAMEKGFADAKEERREIKDEMNRHFDAVETRIARMEAPYFQRKSQDQGRPVERVAEPRPSEEYAAASERTGDSFGATDREAE